jgi:hypothetical protein
VTTPFTAEEELWQSIFIGAKAAATASSRQSANPDSRRLTLFLRFMICILYCLQK